MADVFGFDNPVKRRHHNWAKWEVADNELPMTIADMDLPTSPQIVQALHDKVASATYGYEVIPQEYYEAVQGWLTRHHRFTPPLEWMSFATGVIPALSSLIRTLTTVGDNVLMLTPVYNIFFNSAANNGRHPLASPLDYDSASHTYSINWADVEKKMALARTTMMVVCNPHNPSGLVPEPEDLAHIVRLARQYGVIVVSDEVHGDMLWDDTLDYTPILSLPEPLRGNVIELISPSKTFNCAATHACTVLIADPNLRAHAVRGFNNDEIAEPNLTAVPASIAAYRDSDEWYAAMLSYVRANIELVNDTLAREMPLITPVKMAATYLPWLDCTDLFAAHPGSPVSSVSPDYQSTEVEALDRPHTVSDEFTAFIRQTSGLLVNPGGEYFGNGATFIRMAVACPRHQVEDALARLKRSYDLWCEQH